MKSSVSFNQFHTFYGPESGVHIQSSRSGYIFWLRSVVDITLQNVGVFICFLCENIHSPISKLIGLEI